jgi:hypothetical protein
VNLFVSASTSSTFSLPPDLPSPQLAACMSKAGSTHACYVITRNTFAEAHRMCGWTLGLCYVFRSCFCSCYGCFQKKSGFQHTSKEICIVITRVETETNARPHIRSAKHSNLISMTCFDAMLGSCYTCIYAYKVISSRQATQSYCFVRTAQYIVFTKSTASAF